jgi:hypothetical protein
MIGSLKDEVRMKYLNSIIFGATIPSSAGTLVQPVLPAQGTTNGQREGDSIAIDHIQFRMLLFNPGEAQPDSDMIRVLCLQARVSTVLTLNYATTPATGIFDLGSTGTLSITSFVNYNAINETFHVLYDKSFCVTDSSSTAAILVEGELQPKVRKVNYTPGTSTSLNGAIYWVAFGQEGNAQIDLIQRLVYHDL